MAEVTRPVRYSTQYAGRQGAAWAQGMGESVRDLVHALDHDDLLLIHRALEAYAGLLTTADQAFPNPEQRRLAKRAEVLAEHARAANVARDWIEQEAARAALKARENATP